MGSKNSTLFTSQRAAMCFHKLNSNASHAWNETHLIKSRKITECSWLVGEGWELVSYLCIGQRLLTLEDTGITDRAAWTYTARKKKKAEQLTKLFVDMEEPTLRWVAACKDCPMQTAVQTSQFCSMEGMKPGGAQPAPRLEKPCDALLDEMGSDAYTKAKKALINNLLETRHGG